MSRSPSLRSALLLGLASMFLPLLLLAGIGYLLFQQTVTAFDAVTDEVFAEMVPLYELQQNVLQAAMPPNDYLLHGGDAERHNFIAIEALVDRGFAEIAVTELSTREAAALLEQARQDWERARTLARMLLALQDPQAEAGATDRMEAMDAAVAASARRLEHILRLAQQTLMDHRRRAHQLKRRVQVLIPTMFAVALLLAVAASLYLSRRILLPLQQLEDGVSRLGGGDLDHRVRLRHADELGRLAASFNRMAADLEQLAVRDPLTGLYNRGEFERRLREEIERARRYHHPLCLLLLDLDHFKTVNDTYGHPAGDQVLKAVAALFAGAVRPADRVARWGGEEFAVILPETSADNGTAMAERLRRAVAAHSVTAPDGSPLRLTVSIGVAVYPDDAGDAAGLLRVADLALYAAKRAGRDRVIHQGAGTEPRAGGR